jgi:hypothetical protein
VIGGGDRGIQVAIFAGQDEPAEQIQLGPAITAAFEQFHPVDVPLHGPGGPGQAQGGFDGGSVGLYSAREADEGREPTGLGVGEPRRQSGEVAHGYHLAEALQESVAPGQLHILRQGVLKQQLLGWCELLGWPQAQPAQADAPHTSSPPRPSTIRVGRWPRTAPGQQRLSQQGARACEAEGNKLAVKLADIGTPVRPARLQVDGVWLQRRRAQIRDVWWSRLIAGRLPTSQQMTHRPAVHLQSAGDPQNALASSPPATNLLPARDPSSTSGSFLLCLLARWTWRQSRHHAGFGLHELEMPIATPQYLLQRGTGVVIQVPAIGNLNRVRGSLPACFGVGLCSIACEHLHAWMSAVPGPSSFQPSQPRRTS